MPWRCINFNGIAMNISICIGNFNSISSSCFNEDAYIRHCSIGSRSFAFMEWVEGIFLPPVGFNMIRSVNKTFCWAIGSRNVMTIWWNILCMQCCMLFSERYTYGWKESALHPSAVILLAAVSQVSFELNWMRDLKCAKECQEDATKGGDSNPRKSLRTRPSYTRIFNTRW